MMLEMKTPLARILFALALVFVCSLRGEAPDPALLAKVDARLAEMHRWAADARIVAAIAAQNANLPPEHAAMTQDKWKTLSVLDPFVRGLTRNPAAAALKELKPEWVTEAFLSDATGRKVAFLAKTTSWSHGGSAKHDVPMSGAVWRGKLEVDESTGSFQIQVSVPVLVDGKPAGSLVIGMDPTRA